MGAHIHSTDYKSVCQMHSWYISTDSSLICGLRSCVGQAIQSHTVQRIVAKDITRPVVSVESLVASSLITVRYFIKGLYVHVCDSKANRTTKCLQRVSVRIWLSNLFYAYMTCISFLTHVMCTGEEKKLNFVFPIFELNAYC